MPTWGAPVGEGAKRTRTDGTIRLSRGGRVTDSLVASRALSRLRHMKTGCRISLVVFARLEKWADLFSPNFAEGVVL